MNLFHRIQHALFNHTLAVVLAAGVTLSPFSRSHAVQAPPDMVPIADATRSYVHGWYLDQSQQPGRVLMRLSTAMGNRGTGALELFGGPVSGGTQQVYQRVYDSNGTSQDRLAGNFVYHPTHGHLHMEGFATYNLRTITAGGGVGGIIAAGAKTSFCLINVTQYWPSITSSALVPHGRGGSNCGQVQGISAGYADVYGAGLTDQWIDVTNVPSGTYWLEVIADPDNHIAESDESNNTVRIQVSYTNPVTPPTNRAPVVTNPGAQNSTRGAFVSLPISASDPDGNPITFSALGLPLGLGINSNTGVISGTISTSAASSYSTTVIASDGQLQGSTSFTWNTTAPLNGTGLRAQYFSGTSLSTLVFTRTDALLDFNWGTGSPDARLSSDSFSARWSGKVIPPSTGTHTFTARADDAVRVWINGSLIINQWVAGAVGNYSGTASLTGGQEADITVEYFESTGSAEFHLYWSGPGYTLQIIPTNRMIPAIGNEAPTIFNPGPQSGVAGTTGYLAINATDPNGDTIIYSAAGLPNGLLINSSSGVITGTYGSTGDYSCLVTASDGSLSSTTSFSWTVTATEVGSGLHAQYFNDRTLTSEVVHRDDALVDFDWGTGAPAGGVSADHFSVRWNGEMLPQFSQTYTFQVVCDGGARLWVNNMPMFFAWEPTGTVQTFTATWNLVAGQRTPIRLEYNDTAGNASVRLLWSSASQPEQVIPTARLFPTEYEPPVDTTRPSVTLSTPASSVTGSFPVSVVFSESVLDLTASDFLVTNGSATLTSTTNAHSLNVTPTAAGVVTVSLPADRAFDAAGNGNTSSNTLSVTYAPPSSGDLTGRDIGTVSVPGSTSLSGGVYTVRGSGSDIYYNADSFHFASASITGDGEIKARVTSQTNTNAWAKAGVMIRETLATTSRHGIMYVTPYEVRNGFEFMKRTTTGGATTDIGGPTNNAPPNNWVRLVRAGDTISGYASANGTTWTLVHTATYTTLPATLNFGLCVTGVNNVLGTATFDNVVITGGTQAQPPAAPTALGAVAQNSTAIRVTWTDVATNETGYRVERATGAGAFSVVATLAADVTSFSDSGLAASTLYHYKVSAFNATGAGTAGPVSATTLAAGSTTLVGADIGAVGIAGSTSASGGGYTVRGSGADIYYNADSFHFASTSITGDGEIKARVTSQSNTAAWAKAGVMIRERRAVGSRHAIMYVTPYERLNGFEFMSRTTTNGSTLDVGGPGNNPPPDNWVRLVRAGNTITGYASANGTTWTLVSSATFASLPANVMFGLCVTSASNTVLGTATFDNVSVTGSPGTPLGSSTTRTLASLTDVTVPELITTGAVSFTRQSGSTARYELQLLDDLAHSPAGWRAATALPRIVSNGDGTESVSYPDVTAQFANADRGFARLHVELDTNGDGFADVEKNGEVSGFTRTAYAVGTATAGNPFAAPALGSSAVVSLSSSSVTLNGAIPSFGGASCYLEVRRGTNEGLRFEIDESASSGSTIVIAAGTALPASLVGDSVVVRAHRTVSELFSETTLTGASSKSGADRLMFFNGTAFETLWLWKRADGYQQWVRDGDAALANAGARVIDVTEGVLVQTRRAVTLTISGVVRENAVALPLKAGTKLVANVWPAAMSPNTLGMTSANGFIGARSATSADQIQLWLGDANAGASGYASQFLLSALALPQWTAAGDAALTNLNDAPLFGAARAVFVKCVSDKASFSVPLAWRP